MEERDCRSSARAAARRSDDGGSAYGCAERRLGPYWSTTRSQVYRELPALAEMGYVKLGKPGPRASQPYSITPAGKRAFARWLSEEPGAESLRNPVALRVAFGAHHGATALKDLYSQATDAHNAALTEIREQAKQAKRMATTWRSRAGVRCLVPQGRSGLAQGRSGQVVRSAWGNGSTSVRCSEVDQ